MTEESNVKEKVESPCLDCVDMVKCRKMCYKRVEWGVLEADKDDEELSIYGNNREVKGSKRIKIYIKTKYKDKDLGVNKLLTEFDKLYEERVINPILYNDKERK